MIAMYDDYDLIKEELKRLSSSDNIVLFMKGNRKFPLCGLSASLCFMLKQCNLRFSTINLLTKPNLSLFMKALHNPISAPYLYVGGKFVGGYETVCTMYDNGILSQIAQNKKIIL